VPDNFKLLFSLIYLFFFSSYIIGRLFERKFLNKITAFFVWVGSFWLGAIVYFVLIIFFIDLLRLLNIFFGFIPASFYTDEYKIIFFMLVNAVVLSALLFGYLNASRPVIKELNISISKKAGILSNLKIVMASDIHLGTIINSKRTKKIVRMINSQNPDVILLPGDVVDEDIEAVVKQNCGESLRALSSKFGVYAITGNHEYIGGVEPSVKYLMEHGLIALRDKTVKVADSFYIVGREDRASIGFAGITRKPLDSLLDGVDTDLPLILMDHQPVHLEEAEKNGVDLQLSGHTHHGQIWPLSVVTKRMYEVSMGYKQKGNTHYYVSCGVGSWGPPVRTGNRPEIVVLNLEFIS